MVRSVRRSVTKRKNAADKARKMLATYRELAGLQHAAEKAGDDAQADLMHDHATKRLLWAQAYVQQALALQTHGRLGNANATLITVLREEEARRTYKGKAVVQDPTA
jgi:hypothetical protein